MKVQHLHTAVLHPKPLKKSAAAVYDLLCKHFENKTTLTIKEACIIYANTLIPLNAKIRIGEYNREGKYMVKEVNSRKHFKEICLKKKTYQGYVAYWLKYHMGNLVLNGYAVLIPTINYDNDNL